MRGVKKKPLKLSSPQTVFKSAASQKRWISKLKALSSQSPFLPLIKVLSAGLVGRARDE